MSSCSVFTFRECSAAYFPLQQTCCVFPATLTVFPMPSFPTPIWLAAAVGIECSTSSQASATAQQLAFTVLHASTCKDSLCLKQESRWVARELCPLFVYGKRANGNKKVAAPKPATTLKRSAWARLGPRRDQINGLRDGSEKVSD